MESRGVDRELVDDQFTIGDRVSSSGDDTVDGLTKALSLAVTSGDYPLGTWLRQEHLAKRFGVSRTPISLALSRLEGLGVVERVANRGFRVRVPSVSEILELAEVRGLLEGHAAALAARRIDERQMRVLHESVDEFRRVVIECSREDADQDAARHAWHAANNRFHDAILDACGNRQLVSSIEMLQHRLRAVSWAALSADPRMLEQMVYEHESIAAAIERRDAEQARELAKQHLESARDILLTRLHPDHDARARV